ncbi:N-acyl-D-aspartate/D-glutamate deacylase [Parasphingorhabdus marina DSM 22363]|uniref:N-acyl-D-aspartate/D-glutamate deacylase n=1 Tax=Parasphingorhabdus marina DSM 22363 TaxID=1123272 RepID=A0A1N6DAT6_9SPHN|nr:amidohydrolase family protein [Parasphingorhabdus marina]SIN67813.1 N-acyl-D-aspartate/D-glutamate deacylase [Parasphingorhabdus marina DSM 22363]
MRWAAGFALLALMACQSTGASSVAEEQATLIIRNGTLYDGTGSPGRLADIVIAGDRILHVGKAAAAKHANARAIDASGLIVAPGFIDPHTHAGSDLNSANIERRRNLPFAYQGVTTVLVGNDGHGRTDIRELANRARAQKIGTNVAYLAGFGHVRKSVIGDADRAPSASEMEQMKAMISRAMCEGAVGLSTGLYYTPQNFAKTGEVVELAKVAARHGGYYDTHMRDESTYNIGLSGAVEETLEIGRQSGAAVHIAHIKALGPAVWGHSAKIISRIEAARADGQKVTADQYPWAASGTRISNALVPRWALDGGLAGLRERLADPIKRSEIREGMLAGLKRRGGAAKLLVTGKLGKAQVETGLTLAEIAERSGQEPVDAAIRILETGDARLASFNMDPADIHAFAVQDWVVTGSDGSTGHPRKYGSFPKAYRDFVREEKLITMARFVRRSSGQVADIAGLADRGYVKAGMAADIVIFDPDKFAPNATYQQPKKWSSGVRYLLVNGSLLIERGEHTGALPGRSLLKDSAC